MQLLQYVGTQDKNIPTVSFHYYAPKKNII